MQEQSIGEIKKLLNEVEIEKIPDALIHFKHDQRAGVIKLIDAFEKKYRAYQMELERLDEISLFEKQCFEAGFESVAGIDEVGRGPLAGPVVAAVVILEKGCKIAGINDSKKLSAMKRDILYDNICEKAVDFSVGAVSPAKIDEMNILQATYQAMRLAIEGLKRKQPDYILVDAVTIPKIAIKQKGIIQGDAKSISIGAASIIAKVTRDRIMEEMEALYPGYGFAHNKGYGSAEHIEAIKKIGICPIHRRSFVKNFIQTS